MKNSKPMPSMDYLREILRHDGGVLMWNERPAKGVAWNRRFANKRAAYAGPQGSMRLMIDGVRYYEHRILWKFFHGTEPNQIDHRNLSRSDNDPLNLRPCNNFTNGYNRKRLSYKKTGLPKGVDFDRGKYRARIRHNGRRLYLGLFNTPKQAHAAYRERAKSLHREFARFD